MIESYLQKIRTLIATKRFSQKEFAAKIGKTEQSLGNYFSGKTTPDIETLKKMCEILDVSLLEILKDYDIKEHNQRTSEPQIKKEKQDTETVYYKLEIANNNIKFLEREIELLKNNLKDKERIIQSMEALQEKKNTETVYRSG